MLNDTTAWSQRRCEARASVLTLDIKLVTLLLAFLFNDQISGLATGTTAAPIVEQVQRWLHQNQQLTFYEYELIVPLLTGERRSFVRGRWLDETMHWNWKSNSRDFAVGGFAGRFGEIRWHTTAAGYTTLFDARINRNAGENQAYHAGEYTLDALWLTRLGMPEILFESAEWTRSGFAASMRPGSRHTRVKGELTSISETECQIALSSVDPERPVMRIVVQQESARMTTLVPRRIVRYDSDEDGREVKIAIIITQLLIGAAEAKHFDPLILPGMPRAQLAFYSNDTLYAFAPGSTTEVNRVQRSEESDAYAARLTRKPSRKALLVFMVITLSFAPIAVWVKRKATANNNKGNI
jgi:hypothetical protein